MAPGPASTRHLRADGLSISCHVNGVQDIGSTKAASLFFEIWGGGLGETPVFASVSGYEAAIVTGGCNWACTFGPVLRSAIHGAASIGPDDEVDELQATLDGRRYRVVVSGLDRLMQDDADFAPTSDTLSEARTQLGGEPWLTPSVLESGALPLLTAPGATLLSVFVWESRTNRTVEIKVNGSDWAPAAEPLERLPLVSRLSTPFLRELAVLVPIEPRPPLARGPLERTLLELGIDAIEPWQVAGWQGWQGWQAHRGVLGATLDDGTIGVIERTTGPLPVDYRRFLLEVAGWGAGPGYGLLRPAASQQPRDPLGARRVRCDLGTPSRR